jgi:hypothetical protein
LLGRLPRSVTTPWASAYPDPITCGVDATINCTNSNGVNPPKLTVISSPVEIVASATMGVGATGSAWTVARAGGGTVVVVELVVDELAATAAVVGADELGVDELGVDELGADVSGVDVGPNESAQFSPGAQDLKLKLKKTPIICPGAGAVSTKTLTMRYLLANAFNRG